MRQTFSSKFIRESSLSEPTSRQLRALSFCNFPEADLWDLNLAPAVIESNATGLLLMIRLLYFLRWMGQLKLPP
jgi:hypothetical protein